MATITRASECPPRLETVPKTVGKTVGTWQNSTESDASWRSWAERDGAGRNAMEGCERMIMFLVTYWVRTRFSELLTDTRGNAMQKNGSNHSPLLYHRLICVWWITGLRHILPDHLLNITALLLLLSIILIRQVTHSRYYSSVYNQTYTSMKASLVFRIYCWWFKLSLPKCQIYLLRYQLQAFSFYRNRIKYLILTRKLDDKTINFMHFCLIQV